MKSYYEDDAAQITPKIMNESMKTSSRGYFITSLPLHVMQQVMRMSLYYRESLKSYEPVLTMSAPGTVAEFSSIYCAEQNRSDIILLLNVILEVSFGVNACICSEDDDGILQAMQEFKRSDKFFPLLPDDASIDDIMDCIENQSGMIDTACFF